MTNFVVGLTGGIGSGKTTVSDLFEQHGIDVVDADKVARAIVQEGTPTLAEIVATFGEHILLPNGNLDRAALRSLIFSNDKAKQQLNSIMHPAIRVELLHQLQAAKSPYVLLSAPLLIENKLDALCNRVLVVDLAEEQQKQRTLTRDQVSEAQVEAILASQATRAQRLAKATEVIDNSGTAAELPAQVEKLHLHYLALTR